MLIKGTWIYLFLTTILSILFVYSKSILLLITIEALIIFIFIKVDYKLGIILCVVFIFFVHYKINSKPNIDLTYVDIQAKVIEVKEKYIIVKHDNVSYLVYIQEDMSFIENDIVRIKGQIKPIEKDLDIDVFEFATYLENKRVFYSIDIDKIELINSYPSLSYKIINWLTNKLENEILK